MKGFIFFLLLVGLGAAGYHYREDIQKFVEQQTGGGKTPSEALPEFDATPAAEPGDSTPEPGDAASQPKVMAEPEPAPEPSPEPEPEPQPEPEITNDKYAAQFPLPEFEPIEEVVGNWTAIPASAFPQNIQVKKDVDMMLPGGIGRSTAKAGSTVTALAISGDVLTLATHATASTRGSITMDQTNLKEVLTNVYENFKQRKTQAVLAQRDRARREEMRAEMEARAEEFAKSAGEQPPVAPDGSVPIMVASIQNKDVTEFDVAKIDAWGPVLVDKIDGVEYWTGTVSYKATTIFGTFPAEAMALMRHGKVEKWIYSGSHEPVP